MKVLDTLLNIAKQVNKLESTPKYLTANGSICRCGSSNFTGCGCANVILRNDGLAEIHYSYKINNVGSGRYFNWGLSSGALHELNNDIPLITPYAGYVGYCLYYNGTTLEEGLNGYGGTTITVSNAYWTPGRIYTEAGAYGQWATDVFGTQHRIVGVAFGTY